MVKSIHIDVGHIHVVQSVALTLTSCVTLGD